MKILNCPLNGPRNISEFVWGGEVREMPNPNDLADRDWGAWVSWRTTAPGDPRWWCHVPTSFWFIAERNTVTGSHQDLSSGGCSTRRGGAAKAKPGG
jgi:sarcosine oxidase subunit delta